MREYYFDGQTQMVLMSEICRYVAGAHIGIEVFDDYDEDLHQDRKHLSYVHPALKSLCMNDVFCPIVVKVSEDRRCHSYHRAHTFCLPERAGRS